MTNDNITFRFTGIAQYDEVYQALLKHQVIFIRGGNIGPKQHLEFAESFGELDDPHPHYPHVEGHENIVLLANDANTPPDTNSWHTDLTFKTIQPFASILIARHVPASGGDTMWSSCYAAYNRLSTGMKNDLENRQAVHDLGDFRNTFATEQNGKSGIERLNHNVPRFGHNIRPLIGTHPVTGRKFLNFNEAFVSHIVGLTTNESNALRTFLANHMNKPEDQVRWRWSVGDLAMWDNRVTMHYALADYLPQYRCMNRITIVDDRRAKE
ncbi:MAG: taurine dioxygenase [Gammaproteobacteria bacterium]|nr:taurine dioxygenase [Gammaproteobacteria bacterium]